MLDGLPPDARTRFERLHARCLEMRGIAAGVRGAAGDQAGSAEEIRTPGLDRLLWLFLRLLLSKTALDRFLQTMNEQEISTRLEELRKNLAAAQSGGDDRIVRSLQDSIAMGELRLDNFGRAKKNAEFVADRARSHRRQDPGARRDGRQPPGSRLPQQPGRLGRREHAADREGGQRAAAPHRPRRPARGAAGDPRSRSARGAAAMTPEPRSRAVRPRSCPTWFPAVGVAARRSVLLRHDRGVRAARQHLRPVPHRRATTASRYGVLAEFLAEQLFGRWSLVLHYDLGRGLRAFAGRDEQRLKDMVALANRKVGDLSALPKDPAADLRAARSVRPQQHHGRRRTIASASR